MNRPWKPSQLKRSSEELKKAPYAFQQKVCTHWYWSHFEVMKVSSSHCQAVGNRKQKFYWYVWPPLVLRCDKTVDNFSLFLRSRARYFIGVWARYFFRYTAKRRSKKLLKDNAAILQGWLENIRLVVCDQELPFGLVTFPDSAKNEGMEPLCTKFRHRPPFTSEATQLLVVVRITNTWNCSNSGHAALPPSVLSSLLLFFNLQELHKWPKYMPWIWTIASKKRLMNSRKIGVYLT